MNVTRMSRILASGIVPAALSLCAPGAMAQAPFTAPNLSPAEQVVIAIQGRNASALMESRGTHGVGVGLLADGKTLGLLLFVDRRMPATSLPTQVEGVPVRVVHSDGFVKHDGPCDQGVPCHAGTYPKPVPMGVSTGNINGDFAGTLGFRVHRLGDPSQVGYVTANHVAAADSNLCPAQLKPAALAAFNVNQCQPGIFDSPTGTCALARRIGKLLQVVPLIMGTQFPNVVDAAFVVSKRGCVSKSIRDLGLPTATAAFPVIGDVVHLSGRTSGRLTNKVMAINAIVDVDYGGACGTARFVGQAIAEPIDSDAASRPGDSGAPVVSATLNGTPLGLNFAGDGFVSVMTPMPMVLNALGVQIDTAPDTAVPASCL
jgi:hypothetical protein